MYKPKAREEYISLCKYYDGTEESCEGENGMFAFYEKCWVQMHYPDAEELEAIIVRQEKTIDSLQAEVCRLSALLDRLEGE